ncbi:MAG: hypothetical protein RJA70_4731 [Pseudomonadota bacterium]|jgi:hypothetical protein
MALAPRGSATSYNYRSVVTEVTRATLVYPCVEKGYPGWLEDWRAELAKSEDAKVLSDWLERNPPPEEPSGGPLREERRRLLLQNH